MKRFFVSQDTLRNGRNRRIRTLERSLDSEITPCPNNDYCILKNLKEKTNCSLFEARRCKAYNLLNLKKIR